jgi:hypothetical protein
MSGQCRFPLDKFEEHIVTGVPRPLVEKLLDTIEMNHERGLRFLINAAASLVSAADLFTTEDMTRLTKSLSEINSATRYTEIDIESRVAVSVSLIRAECTRLARALLDAIGEDVSLRQWIDGAAEDPLPEVRFSLISGQKVE